MDSNESITSLKGIGSTKEKYFNKVNVFTIGDLLEYYPVSYEDRTKVILSSEAIEGEKVLVEGVIIKSPVMKRIRNNLTIVKAVAEDYSGRYTLIWYNTPYVKNNISLGKSYFFYGRASKGFSGLQIEMPEYSQLGTGKDILGIIPKYSLTKGLSQKDIRKSIGQVLGEEIYIEDHLSKEIINKYKLVALNQAYRNIHFPRDFKALKEARDRLIIDEFLQIQIAFQYLKEQSVKNSIHFSIDDRVMEQVNDVLHTLPFELTSSQKRVLHELYEDIRSGKGINRLIQGDVGSGKTIIAVIMLVVCLLNGYQGVMMAPTEILAGQHYEYIKSLFATLKINVNITLLASYKSKRQRQEKLDQVSSGQAQIVIATHSVIQKDVVFSNLGLVITDEQHRFGVKQRKELMNKGKNPHVIIMSATPIPRTISLVLYGDLDISTIDTMPLGRKSIKTYCVNTSYNERIYRFMLKEIVKGRQAYVICPAIDENEALNSLDKVYDSLKKGPFKDVSLGMLNGRMKAEEKETIMKAFYENKINVLVSTTVVEVGINVPNATVMLIENAERFGLAQLHQLRGRVGRGGFQSYCILLTDNTSDKVGERMKVLVESNDGFVISQKDLELRGPGDYFGFNQHGLPSFKLANVSKYGDLLIKAKEISDTIGEPTSENQRMKENILKVFNRKLKDVSMN